MNKWGERRERRGGGKKPDPLMRFLRPAKTRSLEASKTKKGGGAYGLLSRREGGERAENFWRGLSSHKKNYNLKLREGRGARWGSWKGGDRTIFSGYFVLETIPKNSPRKISQKVVVLPRFVALKEVNLWAILLRCTGKYGGEERLRKEAVIDLWEGSLQGM